MNHDIATYRHGTCLTGKLVLLSTGLDYFEEKGDTVFTRLKFYDVDDAVVPWGNSDMVGWKVSSVCLWNDKFRVALDEEGMVRLFAPSPPTNVRIQIPEAGVFGKAAAGYGYVERIRSIGKGLYVCGSHRQVHQYVPGANNPLSGHFQNIAGAMRQPPLPKPPPSESPDYQKWLDIKLVNLNDIAGHSETDIYVTGDETWHFDGQTWRQLTLPNDDETMHVIKVIDADTVVIGGANGYLLLGNARTGFKNISSVDDNQTITGLEVFNSTLYIASDSGLFTYNRQSKRIEPYRTDLKVDLVDAHLLEAKDGILWSFGYKDLAYFDGKSWTRVHHPDNPPVDAPQPKKARPAPDDSDDPSEADLAAIAAAQRQALSWLPAAPRRGAAAGSPSLDIGGLFARVGHIGVGQFVLDQLQACGLKPAQILQTKKGERYTVNIPQQGVSLVLQYAPELAADTADDALDKRSPANWALAEVLTQTQYAHSSNHWQGAWLGKLDPNGRNVLAQARALWDEEQASTATQASFFVDAPHGAAWVINLEWTSAQGQLKALKVLNLGGYLPWDEAAAG